MTDMVQGLAQVGPGAKFDMAAPVFLAMWVTMMVAMMVPTIAPIVLLHRLVMRRRGAGPAATGVFVGGYLVVWAVLGAVPLTVLLASRHVTFTDTTVARMCGGVLIVAGAYQFTRWKLTCLRACRTPLTFLSTHDFGTGRLGTARAGAVHGAYCLGCCWALMAVLFAVGLMNLAWMAALAIVFLAEKNSTYGVALTKAAGSIVLLLGVAISVHPTLLASVTTSPPMMRGSM
jgi:predicted metal-binding membrane protein